MMLRRAEGIAVPKETGSRENIFGYLIRSREPTASSDAREIMRYLITSRSLKESHEIKGIGRYPGYLVNPYISGYVVERVTKDITRYLKKPAGTYQRYRFGTECGDF